MGLYVSRRGRVHWGVRLGPIGVAFVVAGWFIGAVLIGFVAVLVLLLLLGSILLAVVALASDRLLVATSASWRLRRVTRGPIRKPLVVIAAIVGAIGPVKGARQRTLTTGTRVAARIGKMIPSAPTTVTNVP